MNKWFEFKMLGDSGNAELALYNEIGSFGITADACKQMIDGCGDIKNLTVRINSYGGDVTEGVAIYNLIKECAAKGANTVAMIDGLAASIASYIAMACKNIKMYDNAFMMIHNPWVMTAGDSNSLRKDADLLDKMKANAVRAYKEHAAKLSDEEISQMMDADTWMDATDAKEWGFVEEVINPTEGSATNMKTIALPHKMLASFVKYHKDIKKPLESTVIEADGQSQAEIKPEPISDEQTTIPNKQGDEGMEKTPQEIARETEIQEAAAVAATERASEIVMLCGKHSFIKQEEMKAFLSSKKTVSEIGLEILNKIPTGIPVAADVNVIKDQADKRHVAMVSGLMVGLGKGSKEDKEVLAKATEKATSIHTLALECAMADGVNPAAAARMDGNDILSYVIASGRRAQNRGPRMESTSSSDLTSVLADVQNKVITQGYIDEPATFDVWADEKEVKDFKQIKFPKLTMLEKLIKMPQGDNFPLTKFSDKQETGSLDTYGLGLTLSRQAIINDDMGLLGDTALAFGGAARRTLNQAAYDLLTSNTHQGPLMTEDGYYMIDTTNHKNLGTAGVPSNTTVSEADSLIRKQRGAARTGETGGVLNWRGRYLISGSNNQYSIFNLCNADGDPTASISPAVPNWAKAQGFVAVTDGYLQTIADTLSHTAMWFLSADKIHSPIVVCYLNGLRTPTIRGVPSEVQESLGLKYDCYFDFAIMARDWRGIVQNLGA